MADDIVRFEATFDKAVAEAQAVSEQLAQTKAIAKQAGDEVFAASVEYQQGLLKGPATRSAADIQSGAAAIERENQLKAAGAKLDTDNLEIIRQQNAALTEQAALRERTQGSSVILPPARRGYQYAEQTAGGQVAAEQQAALRALLAQNQALGEQAALRLRTSALAAQQAKDDEAAAIAAREQLDAASYQQGFGSAAGAGRRVSGGGVAQLSHARAAIGAAPEGVDAAAWLAENQAITRTNVSLGEYAGFTERATTASEGLTANLTRLGVADAEASSQLRRHGALTTEFISALAKGETTVSEFGYQIGATIGKFAGWTAAAAATYGALGAVVEFGKGAIDTSSAVQRLTRTIDDVNPQQAATALENLSRDTNVSMSEAGDAVFQFSRTFHTVPEAVGAARLGLAALKLDNVSLTDSVRASTAINQQYGGGLANLTTVYNELSAAQREYNARISDMIPLLQKSSGAVHNAGGDLTQLIQLGTYATRITQLSGSQVGTALYRGAATFTNPATTKGQSDIATLSTFGIKDTGNFTQLLIDAIRKSATVSENERSQIANAIFGPQYGGRLSAIFNPQALPTFNRITGQGAGGINPQDTRGSLQSELNRELATTGQQLESFINELQRLGAALASTGVIQIFTGGIGVIVSVLDELRQVINVFDELPTSMKEVITAALALRAAMLLVSRTRLGSSFPGLNRVPGFRPSEATQARAGLAIGTRAAIQKVESDAEATSQQLLATGAQRAVLGQQANVLERTVGKNEAENLDLVEQRNSIAARIVQLEAKQVELEGQRTAQLDTLAGLKDQQVVLTSSRFSVNHGSDDRILAIQAAALGSSGAAEEGALTTDTASTGILARAKARTAALLRLNTGATEEATAAMRAETVAAGQAGAASAEEGAVAATDAGAATVGLGTRLATFVSAIDPLTAALVALPFVFQALSSAGGSTDKALDDAIKAAKQPINSLSGLQARAVALQHEAQQVRDIQKDPSKAFGGSGGASSFLSGLANSIFGGGGGGQSTSSGTSSSLGFVPSNVDLDARVLRQNQVVAAQQAAQQRAAAQAAATAAERARNSTPAGRAATASILTRSYDNLAKTAQADANAATNSTQSRDNFYSQLRSLQAAASRVATAHPGPDTAAALRIVDQKLQQVYAERQHQFDALSTSSSSFAGFTPAQIESQIKQLDDYAKVFGAQQSGPQLARAAQAYAYLSNELAKQGHAATDTQLANLATAQSNYIETAKKLVDDLVATASTATTLPAESADLGQAAAAIDSQKQQVIDALNAVIKEDKGNAALIIKAKASADQELALLNQEFASAVLTPQLQAISDASAVAASNVQGSSPGADITRQQIALNGLRQQLAKAQSENAPATVTAGLQAQIGSAQTALNKAQSDNARAILDAQTKVAQASITGISPQADIERAHAAVVEAQRLLQYDQAHGAGEAAILTDQASLYSAEYALNQQLQQRAQQIQQDAQAANTAAGELAASLTTNPVTQARDALNADIKNLATIKPQDYATIQQYQTALLSQKAKINSEKASLTDQIVSTDMATLKFQLDTERIGDQQYIQGLQNLLKLKKLSQADRQKILEEIYNVENQTATDFNTGNISLPSVYQIRRAIGLGQRGVIPGSTSAVINHTANVTVNVYGAKGANAVGTVLDKHLGTSVKAALRAGGR